MRTVTSTRSLPSGLLQQIDAATGAVLAAIDTGVTTDSTWAQIAYGSEMFLFVGSRVDGYNVATRTRGSEIDIGIAPVGAGTVSVCGE